MPTETVYVLQQEDLIGKAPPVFIGAFLAFIFSISLFYFTEWWKRRSQLKELTYNIKRETSFNINHLEKLKIELDRLSQSVAANDKDVYPIYKFDKFQRAFLAKAFERGLLYKKLTDEEINTVDSMFGYFYDTTNQLFIKQIEDFKSDKATPAETIKRIRYDTDKVAEYTDFLKLIQTRFLVDR